MRFFKDRDGRVSHHKRMGWFSPWQAAWINLRAMLILPYTRTVMLAGGVFVGGIALTIPLVVSYLSNDFKLGQPADVQNHIAITGFTAMLSGFLLFAFTLLLHGAMVATSRRDALER